MALFLACLALMTGIAALAYQAITRALRSADQVVADAIRRTDPPAEQQTPGTDNDLLIDAALAYYGPAGLDRLHDAINQHREEEAS
ncbi:hypothetical protein OG762_36555 [Streptomyces sp. NBC_01136]|uniref:hypothetical protein n=1 Tax=Streptomyces sp. NBC_01136 TaxID=2903754 RepID=UPI00386FDC79|nr:hypothetical protein OG762_36555 [Streptomyces sp. NBC_01136]